MTSWIDASRLLLVILVVLLLWTGWKESEAAAARETEPSAPVGRIVAISRGGLRPLPEQPAGRDVLVLRAAVLAPVPSPVPTQVPQPSPPPLPPTKPPTPTPTAAPQPRLSDLGIFRVTGYSDSERNGTDGRGITKSGQKTRWGIVAVDPGVIPLGSRLLIEGMGSVVFTALDTGGGIVGRWVDIWFPSDWEALEHGVQHRAIYLVKD